MTADAGSHSYPKGATADFKTPASTHIKIFAHDDGDIRAKSNTAEFNPVMPRMTTAARDLLTPFEGMFIWNTDRKRFEWYNNSVWLSDNVIQVQNNSGGALAEGDVVIIDTANDKSVTTTTTDGNTLAIGPIVDGGADAAQVTVAIGGIHPVNFNGAVTRGQYVHTSTTVKLAHFAASGLDGDFGRTLEAGTLLVPCLIQSTELF